MDRVEIKSKSDRLQQKRGVTLAERRSEDTEGFRTVPDNPTLEILVYADDY